MTVEYLSSSEAHTVDLAALRAWHWRASMDPNRDHEMRAWHRDQCKWITMRMSAHSSSKKAIEFVALAELLTNDAYEQVHREMNLVCAGDWEKNCQLAREAIIAKLAK